MNYEQKLQLAINRQIILIQDLNTMREHAPRDEYLRPPALIRHAFGNAESVFAALVEIRNDMRQSRNPQT